LLPFAPCFPFYSLFCLCPFSVFLSFFPPWSCSRLLVPVFLVQLLAGLNLTVRNSPSFSLFSLFVLLFSFFSLSYCVLFPFSPLPFSVLFLLGPSSLFFTFTPFYSLALFITFSFWYLLALFCLLALLGTFLHFSGFFPFVPFYPFVPFPFSLLALLLPGPFLSLSLFCLSSFFPC